MLKLQIIPYLHEKIIFILIYQKAIKSVNMNYPLLAKVI